MDNNWENMRPSEMSKAQTMQFLSDRFDGVRMEYKHGDDWVEDVYLNYARFDSSRMMRKLNVRDEVEKKIEALENRIRSYMKRISSTEIEIAKLKESLC